MAHDRTALHVLTAREAGLVGCGVCGRVSDHGTVQCPRCCERLQGRRADSLQKTMAWLAAGLVCYIPANLYPMLKTSFLGHETSSTIVGGVVDLLHHGAVLVAVIVFVASVLIPVSKFLAIGYLVYSVRNRVTMPIHRRIHLYEFVEFVGRWSMIDVFVVAILAALVQLGFVMGFQPGPAAVFFALSVAFTMISALSLDPRLLWDTIERDAPPDD
jgi:paraquat-inducible protein A